MKIFIEAEVLARELAQLARVIEKRSASGIPVLGHVLIDALAGAVSLSATDLDVAMTSKLPAGVEGPGRICSPIDKLLPIVRTLQGRLELELAPDLWLKLKCGSSATKLPGLDPQDFPTLPAPASAVRVAKIPAAGLAELLHRTLFIAARQVGGSTGYPYLHAKLTSDRLEISSTDGHRLSHSVLKLKGAPDVESNIPAKLGQILAALLERTHDAGAEVLFRADERFLSFQVGDATVVSKVPSGAFPNVHRLLDIGEAYTAFEIRREALADALGRLGVVSTLVDVELGPAGMKLKAVSKEDAGQVDELIETTFAAPPLAIGLSIEYLKHFLAVEEADVLSAAVSTPEAALRIWSGPRKSPDHQYLVMPRSR